MFGGDDEDLESDDNVSFMQRVQEIRNQRDDTQLDYRRWGRVVMALLIVTALMRMFKPTIMRLLNVNGQLWGVLWLDGLLWSALWLVVGTATVIGVYVKST